MRRILSLMIATLMILALSVAAGASDYQGLADDLAAIGIFTGTDEGYDLDREPTRAEIAVMLVRMLGVETQAKDGYANGTLTHPFSDVPEWAAPYIAYLYTKGLTSGITDAEFGSDQLCSGQMYCTFMLRALGYSDAESGDFTYVGALAFAQEKSLVISGLVSDSFTRDELVAVSHQTLRTTVKGGEQTLLEKLMAAGSIDKSAASALDGDINTLLECGDFFVRNYAGVKAVDCSITTNLTVSSRQEKITQFYMYDLMANLKFIYADIASKAELAFTVTDPVNYAQYNVHAWIQNGWLYLQFGEDRIKIEIDYEEIRELFNAVKQEMEESIASAAAYTSTEKSVFPSYFFSKVTKTQTEAGTLYEFVISPKFISAILHTFAESYSEETADFPFRVTVANVSETTLIVDDKIKQVTLNCEISLENDHDEDASFSLNFVTTIHALGDDVTITYPDFSDYVEEEIVDVTRE